MRVHGCIEGASRLGSHAHACWAFEQPEEFVDATLEFFDDGMRAGERLAYVGGEPRAEQRERLAALGSVGAMIDTGALQLFELGELYALGEPVDGRAQIATYLAATDQALADGYSGLRVAGEVSTLVAEPHTRDAQVRWESLADRILAEKPISALCGYQREALPEPFLSDLAAVHPASNLSSRSIPFHLFAESGALVLSGEVDFFSAEDLDRVLELACEPGDRIAFDLAALEFIDRHGLEVLADHARRLGAAGSCEMRNPPPVVNRLCELLGLRL
jgi:anti-anti-sigma regulatory factor